MHKMIENKVRIQQQSSLIDSQCQRFPFTLTRTCKTLKVLAFLTTHTHSKHSQSVLLSSAARTHFCGSQTTCQANMHKHAPARKHVASPQLPYQTASLSWQQVWSDEQPRGVWKKLDRPSKCFVAGFQISFSQHLDFFIASEGVDGVTDACVIDPSSPALRHTPTLLSHTSVNCEAS